MNKYYKKIIVILCVALYGTAASAADGYMGLDIGQMNMNFTLYDSTGTRFDGDMSSTVSKVRIGVILLPESSTHLSVESHLGFGIAHSNVDINGQEINIELDSLLALYLKADLLTVGPVSMFGLVGYSTAQTNEWIATESDASFGVGFNYFIDKDWSVQVEYLDVVKRDRDPNIGPGFDLSGVSIGVNRALE